MNTVRESHIGQIALFIAGLFFPLAAVSCAQEKKTPNGQPPPIHQPTTTERASESRLLPPPAGTLYHGVYPGGKSGEEDDLTAEDLAVYERAAGRKAAWVYFSHNWFRSRVFPTKTVEWIRGSGAVPWVRLMLRSSAAQNVEEKRYTLDAILKGRFDEDLRKWGEAAHAFGTPMLAEWGTECNGKWFPWNGSWNGEDETEDFGDPKKPDGAERFAAAYRHIVDVIRGAGATNVSWVFHVNHVDEPDADWNRFEAYDPGASHTDWVAVSAYGALTPDARDVRPFRKLMDDCYPRLEKMAGKRPIVVAEFGSTAGHADVAADRWAGEALDDLLSGRWPKVVGFSWWNERWENGRKKADTTMRLQDTPDLARVFRERLAAAQGKVIDRPVLSGRSK